MKKINLLILSIFSFILLTSCGKSVLLDIEIKDKEVVFNNELHKLTYTEELNDIEVTYENNSHINAGVYEVKAIFSYKNEIKESIATLTIKPYTLEYDDLNIENSFMYDGNVHSILFDEIDRLEYSFEQANEYIEVGVYSNVLNIISHDDNFNSTSIEIDIEITYDYETILNETFIEEMNVEFDYEVKSVLLNNHDYLIEKGFEINYFYNNKTELPVEFGTYNVLVTIHKEHLYKELTTILNINRKEINVNIEGSNLIEVNEDYSFNINVDSNYINVDYRYFDVYGNVIEKPNQVGHYFIEPVLNPLHDNYNIKHSFKHFEIVLPKHCQEIINKTVFNDRTVVYNNSLHFSRLRNHNELIDNGFSVEYNATTFRDVGTYEIIAVVSKDGYIKEFTSTLTIEKLVLNPSILDIVIKEGQYYEFEILDHNNIEYVIYYYNNDDLIAKPSTYGEYKLEVIFNNTNTNIEINNIIHYFNVDLSDYDNIIISNAYLEDTEVFYNGETHRVYVSNYIDLRNERYNVIYTYNNELDLPIEIGTYDVVATIYKNNNIVTKLNCILIIK